MDVRYMLPDRSLQTQPTQPNTKTNFYLLISETVSDDIDIICVVLELSFSLAVSFDESRY